ncbi:hypothetical protein [Streptomyces griseus]|uniref:hypothetical protein n=1 Tax=Streptomyces griseus TaxID=1911 RepID=UPI0004C7CDC0|nr:hypothetical protein [Streptomyces griseus]
MAATIPFTDGLMLRYLRPENVETLLLPAADPHRDRVRSLLRSVYDPERLDIRSVDSVSVDRTAFQTAVHASVTVHGTWDKSIPATEQARAAVELPATPPVQWIDMSLDTVVTVRAARLGGLLASADADAWTAAGDTGAGADGFERNYRLRYADPPPFDPTAPARRLPLRVSALFFDRLDLADALRRLGQARRAVDAASPRPEVHDGEAMLASSAWLAVFPAVPADDPSQATEQSVGALLATQGFVAAFEATA